MSRGLQCFLFGHRTCGAETNYCCNCGVYVEYEDAIKGHYKPLWQRILPDYMHHAPVRGTINHFKRKHAKCPDCGTRNLIRKCGDNCIPF